MIRHLAILCALTLHWTAPALCVNGAPVVAPRTWSVYQLVGQSATWRADSAAFVSDFRAGSSATMARDWSRIVAEDAPVLVASGTWTVQQIGAAMTVTLPDSTGTYFVLHSNSAGVASWSNLTWRP